MTEPLLRRLPRAASGSRSAALPWVRRCTARCRRSTRSIELPFAHGGLHSGARRSLAASCDGRFDAPTCCPIRSRARCCRSWRASPGASAICGEGARRAAQHSAEESERTGRPWWPSIRPSAGDGVRRRRPRLDLSRADRCRARSARPASAAATVLRAGRRIRPRQALARHHFAGSRALHDADGSRPLLLGSRKEAALCEEIAAQAEPASAATSPAGRRCWMRSR